MRRLKSFVRALACLFLSMIVTVSVASAQGTISVPFNEGFVGTVGTNPQKANNITLFSEIGVTRAIFSQTVTSGSIFQIQGNDIPGTLRLTTQNGPLDIPGAIVWRWRESTSEDFSLGFVPDESISETISYTVNGTSGTYTIHGKASDGSYAANTSNFGIALIGASLPGTGTDVSGNAALQSVLDSLNAYLASLSSLQPSGPVAVTSQVTTDTTPTVQGTVTLASGENLEVTINGVMYTTTTATPLVISGSTWSVTLPTTPLGTYNVDAVIVNSGGYVLADATNAELVIETASLPVITGPSGGAGAASSAISVNEEQTGVTTFTASKVVTWSLSGTDASFFDISSSGVVTFKNAPDYETALDSGGNNVYDIVVTATDASSNSVSQNFAVTVLDLSGSALSGTVLDGSGSPVASVTVNLYATSDMTTVVATDTTDSNGDYSFTGLTAGTYTVEFIKANASPRGRTNRGTLNGRFVQSITLAAETAYDDVDGILVDPAGVVYNSSTRQPVSGATARLYVTPTGSSRREVLSSELDLTSGKASGQVTGADGQYTFILNGSAPSGVYEIEITPPSSLVFESTAIAPSPGPYTPSLGGGVESIQSQATAPTVSQNSTYYLSFAFTITSDASTTSNGVINNHIPLDPVSGAVSLTKTASTTALTSASAGSTTLTWTIQAENTGNVTLSSVSLTDTLTNGAGTAYSLTVARSGNNASDTTFNVGDVWTWSASRTLTQADIDSGSLENYARLTATGPNSTSVSVYSGANGVASTSGTAPASGNGVVTTISTLTGAVSLTKTASTTALTSASAGSTTLTWTIQAENTGNVTLSSVSLTDTLTNGAGTAYSLTVARSGNNASDTTFNVGDVWTWSASRTLTQADIDSGSLENYARLTATGPNSTSVSVYSGANGVASTSGTAPASGNGVVTTISTLIGAIQADLKNILRDDLQATISQLTNATSNFVVDAMSRARDYSGGQCAALANAYVEAHPINFETGSSAITEEARIVIGGLRELLDNCDAASLIVAGHTDNVGGGVYNEALSLARARAVIAELRLDPAAGVVLSARGYGSTAPVAPNDDELGRARNRRVEFFAIDLLDDVACSSSSASDVSGSLDVSSSAVDLDLQGLAETNNCDAGKWSGFSWSISSDRRDGASDRDQLTLSYRYESYDPSGAVSGWFVTGYASENEVSRLATGAIDGLGFGAGVYGARPQASGLTFDYLVALYGGRHDFNLSFQRTGGAIVADGDYDYTALHAALGVSGQTVWLGYDVVPRLSLSGVEAAAGSAQFTATRGSDQEIGVLGIGSVSQRRAEVEFAFTDLMPSDASSQWGVTPSLICVNQSQARGTDCGVGLSSSYSVLSQSGVDHVARIEAERYGDSRSIAVEYGYTYPIRGGSLSGGVTTSTRGSVTLQQILELEF